jgi:hypothetical protein
LARSIPANPADIPPVVPGDPRIPPPEDDGSSGDAINENDNVINAAMEAAQRAMAAEARARGEPPPLIVAAPRPTKRVFLSYGPDPATVCISVEEAPDWETIEESVMIVSREAVSELLPIFKLITSVKNLVPGLVNGQRDNAPGEERVRSSTSSSRAQGTKAGPHED